MANGTRIVIARITQLPEMEIIRVVLTDLLVETGIMKVGITLGLDTSADGGQALQQTPRMPGRLT